MDFINKFREEHSGYVPEVISISFEQHRELLKECHFLYTSLVSQNIHNNRTFTFMGVPIYPCEESDIRCVVCGKDGKIFEYNNRKLLACDEHINDVKTFYVLGKKCYGSL